MKKLVSLCLVLIGCVLMLFTVQPQARAHEDHDCPEGIADIPAIDAHVDQADIVTGNLTFAEISAAGEVLFEANFNICDGQGRPATTGTGSHREPENQPRFVRTSSPDSSSCAGCHNRPASGGGGDIVANVFVLAQAADPVLTTIEAEFSNERHTIGMFGSGPIEMLAREMTADLHTIRDSAIEEAAESGKVVRVSLDTKGVHFGFLTVYPDGTIDTQQIEGVDPDLIIKPFHQAGVVISLRQFTVNAMNHHHGMQADERFDLNGDKGEDYDQDGIAHELTIGDITAVTVWQAALDTPLQVLPDNDEELAEIVRGEQIFDTLECTSCHMPELHLESSVFTEPNPYNPDGTYSYTGQIFSFDMTSEGDGHRLEPDGEGAIVRAYTDLKRHNLCDPEDMDDAIRYYCNEQLDQDRPEQDGRPGAEFFLTRKLWDVGSSTSFGHRGDLTTIFEAIMMHGGEAHAIRDAFAELAYEDQMAVIRFLYSLQVVPEN